METLHYNGVPVVTDPKLAQQMKECGYYEQILVMPAEGKPNEGHLEASIVLANLHKPCSSTPIFVFSHISNIQPIFYNMANCKQYTSPAMIKPVLLPKTKLNPVQDIIIYRSRQEDKIEEDF